MDDCRVSGAPTNCPFHFMFYLTYLCGIGVSLIGASLSRSGIMLDPLLLTGRGTTVGAISVGSRADFEAMNRAIALHGLRPVINRTFPFAEAKAAYRHFESRGHFGKVVITHDWGSAELAPILKCRVP